MTKLAIGSLAVGLVAAAISLPFLVGAFREINRNTALLKELNQERVAAQAHSDPAAQTFASASPTKTAEASKATPAPEVPKPQEKAAQAVTPTPVTGFSPGCASVPLVQAVNRTPRAAPYEGELRVSWQYPGRSSRYAERFGPCLASGIYVHPTLGKFSVSRR